MPLTDFQREVLSVIVANRSEESHFAGGLVLNAACESARFSKDFDFFHDGIEALAAASERDAAILRAAGFEVILDEPASPTPSPTCPSAWHLWMPVASRDGSGGIRRCVSTDSACAGRGHHRWIKSWKAIVDLR